MLRRRLWTTFAALVISVTWVAGCDDEDPIVAYCGDGILDPGEECDGANLGGFTCDDGGFYAGTPTCTAACTISFDTCHNCGDGVLDAGEECDGAELGGASCVTEGYDAGDLACLANCTFDTSGCYDEEYCYLPDFTSLDAEAFETDEQEG